jgi:hypothetical protein
VFVLFEVSARRACRTSYQLIFFISSRADAAVDEDVVHDVPQYDAAAIFPPGISQSDIVGDIVDGDGAVTALMAVKSAPRPKQLPIGPGNAFSQNIAPVQHKEPAPAAAAAVAIPISADVKFAPAVGPLPRVSTAKPISATSSSVARQSTEHRNVMDDTEALNRILEARSAGKLPLYDSSLKIGENDLKGLIGSLFCHDFFG